jgi:small subunit ribosomal protein S21
MFLPPCPCGGKEKGAPVRSGKAIHKPKGVSFLPTIFVDDTEPIEKALKRFKKECQKSGILAEVRRREFYEKPCVKRKRAEEASARKHRRRMQKIQAKLDMM